MALRDAAVVGYAETKIVEKSDRDVWEIGAEILATLLDKTGFEKGEIDGLILSSSMTGASNAFWSQTTADQLGLELDFCQTVDVGGSSPTGALARAAAALDAGLATTVFCLYADTQVAENNSRQRSFHGEWAAPLGYLGPPAAFGLLSKRYEHQFGLDYRALGKLAVAQRNHALLNDNACEKLRKPITVDDYHQLAHDRRSDPAAGQRDGVRRRQRPAGDHAQARQAERLEQVRGADRLWRAHQLPRRREHRRCDRKRPLGRRQARVRDGGNRPARCRARSIRTMISSSRS